MWPRHLVTQRAAEMGMSPHQIRAVFGVLDRLEQNGLPPILSLRHLCLLTGASYKFLRRVIGRSEGFHAYKRFYIDKRSGGRRLIHEPHAMLKHVQRWLNVNLFHRIRVHHSSYAFSEHASIVKCATRHCGARWLVKIDIKNFFESMRETELCSVLIDLGYPSLVAFEISRLCTYPYRDDHPRYSIPRWRAQAISKNYSISAYNVDQIGHLPQGAPTSPLVANILCREMDAAFCSTAHSLGWEYTRYADDISFSCLDGSREAVKALLKESRRILVSSGFEINQSKTSISPPGARKVVLGLLVDSTRPRLSREYRATLEMHLYYAEKYGVGSHAKKRHFQSPVSFIEHLRGNIAFASQVDKKIAEGWSRRLNAIQRDFLLQTSNESD